MLRHTKTKFIRVSFLGIVLCVLFITNSAFGEPVLEENTFVAAGYNETLLHIDTPGRYSIQASSKQGTWLELVDRTPRSVSVSDGLYLACAGAPAQAAARLVEASRRKGEMPEPLRLAHLIASAVARGQSRGRV